MKTLKLMWCLLFHYKYTQTVFGKYSWEATSECTKCGCEDKPNIF
jgi:hypothetical protein